MKSTHVIESSAVLEHQQDVIDELFSGEVVKRVAFVQFSANHRQVDGPLDDLVVVLGLENVHILDHCWERIHVLLKKHETTSKQVCFSCRLIKR